MTGFEGACKVVNYIIDILSITEPDSNLPTYRIWSFSMSAADDILAILADHPNDDFEDLLNEYILQTQKYMVKADGKASYDVFKAANDTAMDIMCYLKQISKGAN